MQERNALDARMTALTTISRDLADNLELAEMAEDEGDEATLNEAAKALVEAGTGPIPINAGSRPLVA